MRHIIALAMVAMLWPFAASAAKAPSTKAYEQSFHTMHQGMSIQYTGDVDTDFTRGMIPHHQGAIDMARVVLKYGHDEQIRSLAEWIMTIQKQEIAKMQHWLTRRGVAKGVRVADYDEQAVAAFTQQMHEMHRNMNIQFTGDADLDFVNGMIPHHQGAIDMAYTLLRSGEDPELNKLAWGIITSQKSEIASMQRWLHKHGGQAGIKTGIEGSMKTCDGMAKKDCCCKIKPCLKKKDCCCKKKHHSAAHSGAHH